MATDLRLERTSMFAPVITPCWVPFKRTYECRVKLCPEKDGGYSAHSMRLAGVISEGETEPEAIANITDAFRAVVQTYLSEGMPIPWGDVEIEDIRGSKVRWILVDV